jgi:hypothetical protein
MELSIEERQKEVQLGRDEMYVDGVLGQIILKIRPDEGGSMLNVCARRNPKTGEMALQMRRGQRRTVVKGKDGMWRQVK